MRFIPRGANPGFRSAAIESQGRKLAELTYAPSALVWRMNLGWRRSRADRAQGFTIDVERGCWAVAALPIASLAPLDTLVKLAAGMIVSAIVSAGVTAPRSEDVEDRGLPAAVCPEQHGERRQIELDVEQRAVVPYADLVDAGRTARNRARRSVRTAAA